MLDLGPSTLDGLVATHVFLSAAKLEAKTAREQFAASDTWVIGNSSSSIEKPFSGFLALDISSLLLFIALSTQLYELL